MHWKLKMPRCTNFWPTQWNGEWNDFSVSLFRLSLSLIFWIVWQMKLLQLWITISDWCKSTKIWQIGRKKQSKALQNHSSIGHCEPFEIATSFMYWKRSITCRPYHKYSYKYLFWLFQQEIQQLITALMPKRKLHHKSSIINN